MSYFVCALNASVDVRRALAQGLAGVVPDRLRVDPLGLSENPYLVVFGHRKVIPHLWIADEPTRSWLAVLGTPLVSVKGEAEHKALLGAFLENPSSTLR